MHEWNDFFVATAGAAAALTGLIFVGVSINLNKILSFKTLPSRALLSLGLLFNILILSIFFLIPKQTYTTVATEVLIIESIVWIVILCIDIFTVRNIEATFKRQQILSMMLDQLALVFYLISGVAILFFKEAGIYWIVPGFILSFFKAVLDAWVLLVEIQR